MKTRYKLLLAVLLVWAQVFAFSLTGRAGEGSALYAQDAFYIYRNDGDFNGFFFDEVVRMGYSKLDLDSIEHDEYVVQEVELADTIYRIPLAAIDSIGFQQPEIKINPKVKLMRDSGLLPYVERAGDGWVWFKDLPDNLKPQIGDILIGLPTDETNEHAFYGKDHEGFSCVVEYFETYTEDNLICAHGREVEDINEVFEQYITVEDLGYDEQGNLVRRRVAGMPHPVMGKTDNINLIHLQGTIQNEWKPDENASISLAADVDVVFRVRLAYNIGWKRFFVKLTKELIIDAKPSVSTSVSRGFDVALGNTVAGFGIPLRIWFPTECPIFELEPYPDWFIRGEGKIEAKFKFPKIHLGFGGDIIFDTNRLFPIDLDLHWVPEENKNDNDLIDIGSTNVSLSGFLQTGLKFQVNISTARWFQKLFKCQLGANIYAGPKIDGVMELSTDWLNNEGISLYNLLSNASINATWLSLDVNAGTTASVLWGDELNKTFYSANYPFFCDTLRFIPRLTPEVIVNDNNVRVILHSRHDMELGYYTFKVYIKDGDGNIVHTIGDWGYRRDDDIYTGTCPASKLYGGISYTVYMTPTWAGHILGDFPLTSFVAPKTMELDTNRLVFESYDPSGTITKSVSFTTNCRPNTIGIYAFGRYRGNLKVIDEEKGQYQAEITVGNNTDIFSPDLKDSVYIGIPGSRYYIECVQKAPDLNNINMDFQVDLRWCNMKNNTVKTFYSFKNATLTRLGDSIEVTYLRQTTTEGEGTTSYKEQNIRFVLSLNEMGDYVISEGSGIIKDNTYQTYSEDYVTSEFTFGPISGKPSNVNIVSGKINSASITTLHRNWDGQEWGDTQVMNTEEDSNIQINFLLTAP